MSSLGGMLSIFWIYGQYNNLNSFFENFNDIRIKIQQSISLSQRFLLYETTNLDFYINPKSEILEKRQQVIKQIYHDYLLIKKNELIDNESISTKIDSIKWFLDEDDKIMQSLVEAIRHHGFKDFGIEGKMREYVHKLEENKQVSTKILMLRRWEKDYMLRNDSIYIVRVENEIKSLKADFRASAQITNLLDNYFTAFKIIVALDKTIGKKADTGLNHQLRLHGENTEKYLKNIAHILAQKQAQKVADLQNIFWQEIIFMTVIGLIISYLFSQKLTRPLLEISEMVNMIAKKNFDGTTPIIESKSKDEIGVMTRNLGVMIKKMRESFILLKSAHQNIVDKNIVLIELNQKLIESEAKLKESNQIKDKFFSIIAHDLRGPFNTLKGFMNIMVNYADGFTINEIKDFVGQINETITNLSELTNNLLKWALLQMEEIEVEIEEINLFEAVADNFKLLQKNADSKEISLLNLVNPAQKVQADKNILYFVLRNLVSNAIKFTPDKGIIKIEAHHFEQQIYIQVIDNGVGMENAILEKLFKVGEKFTTQGTRKEKGTGLGLILCKEFLKKCNSNIFVNSEINKGTIFSFNLPLNEDAAFAEFATSLTLLA